MDPASRGVYVGMLRACCQEADVVDWRDCLDKLPQHVAKWGGQFGEIVPVLRMLLYLIGHMQQQQQHNPAISPAFPVLANRQPHVLTRNLANVLQWTQRFGLHRGSRQQVDSHCSMVEACLAQQSESKSSKAQPDVQFVQLEWQPLGRLLQAVLIQHMQEAQQGLGLPLHPHALQPPAAAAPAGSDEEWLADQLSEEALGQTMQLAVLQHSHGINWSHQCTMQRKLSNSVSVHAAAKAGTSRLNTTNPEQKNNWTKEGVEKMLPGQNKLRSGLTPEEVIPRLEALGRKCRGMLSHSSKPSVLVDGCCGYCSISKAAKEPLQQSANGKATYPLHQCLVQFDMMQREPELTSASRSGGAGFYQVKLGPTLLSPNHPMVKTLRGLQQKGHQVLLVAGCPCAELAKPNTTPQKGFRDICDGVMTAVAVLELALQIGTNHVCLENPAGSILWGILFKCIPLHPVHTSLCQHGFQYAKETMWAFLNAADYEAALPLSSICPGPVACVAANPWGQGHRQRMSSTGDQVARAAYPPSLAQGIIMAMAMGSQYACPAIGTMVTRVWDDGKEWVGMAIGTIRDKDEIEKTKWSILSVVMWCDGSITHENHHKGMKVVQSKQWARHILPGSLELYPARAEVTQCAEAEWRPLTQQAAQVLQVLEGRLQPHVKWEQACEAEVYWFRHGFANCAIDKATQLPAALQRLRPVTSNATAAMAMVPKKSAKRVHA